MEKILRLKSLYQIGSVLSLALILLVSIIPVTQTSPEQRGPKTDKLRFLVIKGPDAKLIAMLTITIDVLADLIRTGDIDTLDSEGFTITSTLGFHIAHIGFNIRPNQNYRGRPEVGPVLSDVNFRHALIHAYDQEAIVASIYAYIATPVSSLVPPAQGGWVGSTPTHPYNPGDPLAATEYPGDHSASGILRYGGYLYDPGQDNWATPYDLDNDGIPGTNHPARPLTVLDPDDVVPTIRLFTPTYEIAPTEAEHGALWIADLHAIGLTSILHEQVEFWQLLGDIDGDGDVDPDDFYIFSGAYGTSVGDPAYDERCDLDNDGDVDPDDFYIFSGKYGKRSLVVKVFGHADFDMYMVAWSLGRFPDHLYEMLHSSQDTAIYPWRYNAPGVNDPYVDERVETVKFSLNHIEKLQAAWDVQDWTYDADNNPQALPYMQLYSRSYFNAFNPGLRGIIKSPGYGSDNAWAFLNMRWEPGHPNERIEDGESTVIWSLADEPPRLNPLYIGPRSPAPKPDGTPSVGWTILGRIYDPLIMVNPYTHEDKTWLATSWESVPTPDGPGAMNITFYLRDDVYWQDGEQYTAEDAAFNWLFLRDNQIPKYASMWEHLIDVEIIDTYTVRVILDTTSQFLLYDYADTAAILPPQVWTDWDGRPLEDILGRDPSTEPGWNGVTPTNLFGTGPFMFQFYDPVGMVSELLANRNYFKTTDEIQAQLVWMFWKCGDVNRDGVVEVLDLARVIAAYGSVPGDPNWDPDADINEDDIVDGGDLAIVQYYWAWQREYP